MSLFFPKIRRAERDFEASSLPKNRREVFADVCRLHWGRLLQMGAVLLLFALPLLGLEMYRDTTLIALAEQARSGTIEAMEGAILHRQLDILCGVIAILFGVMFAVGLAGVMRMIKRYAWLENVSFAQDFVIGIRQNGGQYMALFTAAGLVRLLCIYGKDTMVLLEGGISYEIIGRIPTVFAMIFLLPVAAFAVPCIAVYANRLRLQLRYGVLLYLKGGWRALAVLLLCAAPGALMLMPKLICHVAGGILFTVLLPFGLLIWFLFASELLDETINREYYPELMRRGLQEGRETPESIFSDQRERHSARIGGT